MPADGTTIFAPDRADWSPGRRGPLRGERGAPVALPPGDVTDRDGRDQVSWSPARPPEQVLDRPGRRRPGGGCRCGKSWVGPAGVSPTSTITAGRGTV